MARERGPSPPEGDESKDISRRGFIDIFGKAMAYVGGGAVVAGLGGRLRDIEKAQENREPRHEASRMISDLENEINDLFPSCDSGNQSNQEDWDKVCAQLAENFGGKSRFRDAIVALKKIRDKLNSYRIQLEQNPNEQPNIGLIEAFKSSVDVIKLTRALDWKEKRVGQNLKPEAEE